MTDLLVYMDNHSTTRVDPRVVEAMLPLFDQNFGNPGSTSHASGWDALEAVDRSRQSIAVAIGAQEREIVFTSGATESNNLAFRGLAERRRRRGNHILSVTTEHRAVLDPLERLGQIGFETTLLRPELQTGACPGWLDPQKVEDAIRDDTLLVSVMLANNEIGVIQSLAEIGAICKRRNVLLHTDATQAVGKIPVDVSQLQVDLMSFTGHKLYGPKGIGALYVRRRSPSVRLVAQIDGGGQEMGIRSGTLNVPGIVGFAKAISICVENMTAETERLALLAQTLYDGLADQVPDICLNGPPLSGLSYGGAASEDGVLGAHRSEAGQRRLVGNVNVQFAGVDGEALMLSMRNLAVSSGSACTSANPAPSHVLRSLGLSDDETRSSLRFGLGRFNTANDVSFAITTVAEAVTRLRRMST